MKHRRAGRETHAVREVTDFDGEADKENHVFRNVAVLGSHSRNGRRYTNAALQSAARVFEGTRVFLNHREQQGTRTKPHDVRDYVGRLTGLHVDGDLVRARELTVVNESHWPLLTSIDKDPKAFGLSIDGEGKMKKNEVTEVTAGRSVDLVSDPATVRGLFEEIDNGADEMKLDELTLEDLQTERADLVTKLREDWQKEHDKKLKEQTDDGDGKDAEVQNKLSEELAELRQKLATAERNQLVESALREARIAKPSDALRTALGRCENAKEMTALLNEVAVSKATSAPAGKYGKDEDRDTRKKRFLEAVA